MRVIIERGKKRYEVLFDFECTDRCSFATKTKRGVCEDRCNLPKWFKDLTRNWAYGASLREIKEVK